MRSESYGGTRLDFYDGWVEITVPGYPPFQAVAQSDRAYVERAAELGFADKEAMNYEHDRAHAWLAKRLGLRVSPALLRCAQRLEANEVTDAEETFVLAFHRFKNILVKHGLWSLPV